MLYKICVSLLTPFIYLFFRLRVTGKSNIPSGAAVVCGNHSSNLDPIVLGVALGVRNPLCFMAKKELFDIPVLRGLLRALGTYPVDRGAADLKAIKDSVALLKSGKKVMLFPQGTRVKDGLSDTGSVKTGIALLAVRAGVPIVPVYIPENIHLFKRTNVIIGKPVIPEMREGTASENYRRISDDVFKEILSLKESQI
ncbi:MAG: 1-acyl-sn-glycerol-3-phosphate acyltransferase [Clostridiales bacterium]|jgi:1-acyl-sn-glycerol-3-phosphate acyltransferase|nr:1-acyl-sn-glycerol-3-phosphate acyltransferase [Clostridiales bacterium]